MREPPSNRHSSRGARGTNRVDPVRKVAEISALAILVIELAVILGRISTSIDGWRDVVWMVPAAFLGVLLTDFISGVVHWLCDTFGDETTPILGRHLIAPFREHHRAPGAMTQHGMLRVNHNNCVGIVIVLGVCLWLDGPEPDGPVFGYTFLLAFACAVYLTNTIHRWAHQSQPPAVARWLQRLGLAITAAHHARHHVAGRGSYCITTGWLNPLLDRSQVLLVLERAGGRRRRAGGRRPMRRIDD